MFRFPATARLSWGLTKRRHDDGTDNRSVISPNWAIVHDLVIS